MSDPSYRDVAEWLPTDIREHIEATAPCRLYGGHYWQQSREEVRQFGVVEPVRLIEKWYCLCGIMHTINPATWL